VSGTGEALDMGVQERLGGHDGLVVVENGPDDLAEVGLDDAVVVQLGALRVVELGDAVVLGQELLPGGLRVVVGLEGAVAGPLRREPFYLLVRSLVLPSIIRKRRQQEPLAVQPPVVGQVVLELLVQLLETADHLAPAAAQDEQRKHYFHYLL